MLFIKDRIICGVMIMLAGFIISPFLIPLGVVVMICGFFVMGSGIRFFVKDGR